MTRILQIRRGSTAANDNFTGCAGEITMDTDKNTLRIHDGHTLGGFQMARADMGGFDITTVSDEFWSSLFARHGIVLPNIFDTNTTPINSNCSYLDYILGDIVRPRFVQTFLVCQNAACGYATGDYVFAFGIGNRTNPHPNITHDTDGYHLNLMTGNDKYWVSHRETGVPTFVNDSDWCVAFRLYC